MKFEVEDRVFAVNPVGSDDRTGATGTVVKVYENGTVDVEYDDDDFEGWGPEGNMWNSPSGDLEYIPESDSGIENLFS